MLLAMAIPAAVIVAVGFCHYFFWAPESSTRYGKNHLFSEHSSELDKRSSTTTAKTEARRRLVMSFTGFGRKYRIIPDDFDKNETVISDTSQEMKIFTIYSADALLSAANFNAFDAKFRMTPPTVTQARTTIDQGRAPFVRTRTEPHGIRNRVTIVIMLDSLGKMIPIVESEDNKDDMLYLLSSGSSRDAKRVLVSLQDWTFAPAWDKRGRPTAARFTITHIPRNR
ncbi:hypothetical protein JYU19_02430 [bacterium AH-315-J21]|nr:hypothetical protein [bacterium AH-315-J21]